MVRVLKRHLSMPAGRNQARFFAPAALAWAVLAGDAAPPPSACNCCGRANCWATTATAKPPVKPPADWRLFRIRRARCGLAACLARPGDRKNLLVRAPP